MQSITSHASRLLPLLTALLLAGMACATSGPPIAVRTSPAEFEALVGEWNGTYSSRDTRRSGSIWFQLIAGEDHAHGDVLMTASGRRLPFVRNRPDARSPAQSRDKTQVLCIRFVRAAGGAVEGQLEPYWDPECECEAQTVFQGRLADNRLEGTFHTRLASGSAATGVWSATKQ